MKRRIIFGVLALATLGPSAYSQNTFPATGNVGIGTTVPGAKLDIIGDVRVVSPIDGQAVKIVARTDEFAQIAFYNSSSTRINSLIQTHGDGAIAFVNALPLTEKLRILADGRIGIGTASPTHKLTVNGTIRAKEIVVDNTGWADFVFTKNYKLASLTEVEKHIEQQGHLPGIPSAAEVKERGVSVGEMQAKLLEKIEELTLRLIAQEKRLNAQDAEIAALKVDKHK
ncbi:hypothetical protein [Nibricoccus sp. IMCC34717]|uniref:hypothetical protein n=1 Tax=Nibricoccus sp. IMCC34717 TaxID=3034021 RepID=UPI00384D807B